MFQRILPFSWKVFWNLIDIFSKNSPVEGASRWTWYASTCEHRSMSRFLKVMELWSLPWVYCKFTCLTSREGYKAKCCQYWPEDEGDEMKTEELIIKLSFARDDVLYVTRGFQIFEQASERSVRNIHYYTIIFNELFTNFKLVETWTDHNAALLYCGLVDKNKIFGQWSNIYELKGR